MISKDKEIAKKFNRLAENLQNNYGLSFDEILELTLDIKEKPRIHIPIEVLKNRDLGILESTVIYLKDKKNLRFSEIGRLLERNDRTIWATYHKAKEKINNER